LMAVLGLMSACSDSGGGSESSGQTCSASIRGEWAQLDFDYDVDLRNIILGQTQTLEVVMRTGEICEVTGSISGSECSGSWEITTSTYTSGGSGDPGCASFIGEVNYSVTGNMEVCAANDPSDCLTYFRHQ